MKENIEYIVLIVGAGGTGGNFAKEFARYMSTFFKKKTGIRAVLIDGDIVEKKNLSRQPFVDEDAEQNKALVLSEAIQDTFALQMEEWMSWPHYIESSEQLEQIFESMKGEDKKTEYIPVLVGCVDNHRARQCMHEFFCFSKTCIYIDSANEFSVGEVVCGIRAKGKTIAPDRTYYYPEILIDQSPSAAETSCGTINISAPQHIATNLMAANLTLSMLVDIISNNNLPGGIIYFNREKFFSRFRSYEEMRKGENTHEL